MENLERSFIVEEEFGRVILSHHFYLRLWLTYCNLSSTKPKT